MQDARFLYGWLGSTCIIKAVGSIQYRISPLLDAFVRYVRDDPRLKGFIIDLSETDYIDSTNLGLLARLQIFSVRHLGVRPTIISVNPTINDILDNIGFHKLFDVVASPVPCGDMLEDIAICAHGDNRGLNRIVLDAHRYLATIDSRNAQAFRNVVDFAQHDVGDEQESEDP